MRRTGALERLQLSSLLELECVDLDYCALMLMLHGDIAFKEARGSQSIP